MSIRIFLNRKILSIPVLKRWNSVVPIAAHRSTRAIPNANTAAPDYEKTKKHPQGCFFFCNSPPCQRGVVLTFGQNRGDSSSAFHRANQPSQRGRWIRCLRRRRKRDSQVTLRNSLPLEGKVDFAEGKRRMRCSSANHRFLNGRIISAPTVIVMMFLLL